MQSATLAAKSKQDSWITDSYISTIYTFARAVHLHKLWILAILIKPMQEKQEKQ